MMAGLLMVEEAGGKATRFDGSPLGLVAAEVLASNGPIHGAMLDVVREEEARAALPGRA